MILSLVFSVQANALNLEVNKGQILHLPRPAVNIFIADPQIADIDVRSPNYVYVYGVGVGETTLHALDAEQNSILSITISVSHSTGELSNLLREILPDSKVTFKSINGGLLIRGTVDTPEQADIAVELARATVGSGGQIINMLKVNGSDQVMLRVRVAEVAREEIKNFGINLGAILTKGDFAFGLFTGRPLAGAAGTLINDGNISIAGRPGRVDASAVIDALETEGLVKVLAEPNLTAKSGQTASFLAGGEYPIPVPQEDGVIAIEYREFGVRLAFTPTVLSGDRISLSVAPEVSTLGPSAVTLNEIEVPTLLTRRASTTVELGSGESFAIAGLVRNDTSSNISKFPWLGDIPVLGTLFRSNSFQINETELVIIATPYIVRGVKESEKLLTPADGYEAPNDFERILLGRHHSSRPAGTGAHDDMIAAFKLNGDVGFVLE